MWGAVLGVRGPWGGSLLKTELEPAAVQAQKDEPLGQKRECYLHLGQETGPWMLSHE